ncbi:MAG TPA: lysophospholipid acyltransferase family protein [Ignavibacteria bacterium]|nr:lysophospholipid acyltransferase family protein [Ignavibacteria bacterium]HMQ98517.1 lysophospholipid acyltransferase family protein [Ignavibacteria bacterium]
MNFLLYILFELLKVTIPLFPLGFIQFAARLKGKMFYYILPIRKQTAISNLKRAFPDKSAKELNEIVKGCYVNVLTVIAEFFYMRKLSVDKLKNLLKVENPGLINEKLEHGKGVILISAHFGNWELTAYGVSKMINIPFNVIVKEQTNKRVNEGINSIRTSGGNRMIDMKNSLREILTVLKSNGIVAMLGDQSAPKENVKVKFFLDGVPTYEGTARIAIKTGADVLFGVSTRNPDGTYSLKLHEIDTSKYKESTEDNVKALTQAHVDLLVEYIERKPDHWLWFHRRFKNVG